MATRYMTHATSSAAPVAVNNNNNTTKFSPSSLTTSSYRSAVAMNYEFIPPPEAPVFYPTEEEFAAGPLKYIAKIRADAEPHGICKIIPPKSFQPSFAVNVDEFRFTPRVQRLNEMEATTRIKLNFIEQLVKFWDLQGSPVKDKIRGASFKIPNLERRALDLFNLHKIVKEEGGFETCTRERKWSKVASKMGYCANSFNRGTIASLLRQHYERILFPYDVFQSGANIVPEVEEKTSDDENANDVKVKQEKEENGNSSADEQHSDNKLKPEKRVLRRQQTNPQPIFSPNSTGNQSKELKKLQVYGAGPKMPGVLGSPVEKSEERDEKPIIKDTHNKVCLHCDQANPMPMLLTCDNCDNAYHMLCLIPPLADWPKGVWHCHRCLAHIVQSHPQPYTQEFGFVQSQRQYTLSEFGAMADQFKTDYFSMPHHTVPLNMVEKEFWRLVSSLEENVVVEYGADLHTNDYGSGFPTKKSKNLLPPDMDYLDSPWNLNNLPILEGSVFRHINANINGMIIPWMYVGMCFATFCWHNEDHWTYSINFLHWGEPKTWYGVPGEFAETFERAMKRAAPELFQSQPDLLHQLVTICNPNILMQDGVPVYRTNQQAGEFVVTFPRAYHAGFNQGLNFAEAVNFAPPDWLPIGRVCITHYAMLHRYPVFSHDELICKMANDPEHLEISIASETYRDMQRMVESEKSMRLALLEWGVTQAEREAFELLPDDERQCEFCKTTCFLSALTCKCDSNKLVCIYHKDNLCQKCLPVQHTLRYRYTLDELPIMLHRLRTRAEQFEKWAVRVKEILRMDDDDEKSDDDDEQEKRDEESKITLKELKQLLTEAITYKYPTNLKVFEELQSVVADASKCSRAARDLIKQQEHHKKQLQFSQQNGSKDTPTKRALRSTSGRSANASNSDQVNNKLTVEEISLFYDELMNFPCQIPEANQIKELANQCNQIAKSIADVVDSSNKEPNDLNSKDLDELLQATQGIAVVDFGSHLSLLRHKLEEIRWLEECQNLLFKENPKDIGSKLDLNTIKNLIESGMKLAASTDLISSRLIDLQQILDDANRWIEKAKIALNLRTDVEPPTENSRKTPIETLEALLIEVDQTPNLKRMHLHPYIDKVKENVKKAREWTTRVNSIFHDHYKPSARNVVTYERESPMIDLVEELVADAGHIECQLEHLPNLNSTISAARAWRERLNRTFCKKNSLYSLLDILIPRTQHSFPQLDLNTCSSRTYFQHLKRLTSQTGTGKDKKIQTPTNKLPAGQKTWFESQLNGNFSRVSIVALYKMLEHEEMTNIVTIRDKNKVKSDYLGAKIVDFDSEAVRKEMAETDLTSGGGSQAAIPKRICLCTKEASEKLGWLVQCNLCNDWFHHDCLQQLVTANARKKQGHQSDQVQSQQHLLCVLCSRGRRPRLETILSLLCSLQKLPIRIFEGELLQCLAERAMNWQEKTRSALNLRSDLANGLHKVCRLQSGQSAFHSPVHSPASPPLRPHHPRPVIVLESPPLESKSTIRNRRTSEEIADEESTAEALLQLQRSHIERQVNNNNQLQPGPGPSRGPGSSVESTHSESTISASSPEPSLSNDFSPSKHKRKSPLILRGDPAPKPLIDLTEESRRILAELIVEGDCLEVALDELNQLWSIWQLANPNIRTAIHYNSLSSEGPSLSHKRKLSFEGAENATTKKKKPATAPKEKRPKSPKGKKNTNGKKVKKEEDEVCSMREQCRRPNVDEVNWVQCDGPCEGWFHQLCIGIDKPEDIAEEDQFFCSACKSQTAG